MSEPFAETPSYPALIEAARACPPRVAVVLGSGMGDLARHLKVLSAVSFAEVPGLSAPSVAGHRGQLVLGEWAGQRTLVFQGRLHYYEGCPWRSVVAPIHAAHFLGARVLLVTNAAGGIHGRLGPGSLMVIRDQLQWTLPGARGLCQTEPSPYSPRLVQVLLRAAHDLDMDLSQGTYASVLGPNYETPAEIRALQSCGADAVGMSTAHEVLAGYELGMECAAVSCITNRAAGLRKGAIEHAEVLTTAQMQIPRLAQLLERFLGFLTASPAGLY